MTTEYILSDAKVLLKDIDKGKGEIVVWNSHGNNYSYFWGAMGSDIKTFIKQISADYLAGCFIGRAAFFEFDADATFKELRSFIKSELGLPFYKHMEFQKDMRVAIREFQNRCSSLNDFVHYWDSFIMRLDFTLIGDSRWEQESVEKEFKSISEPWHFGQTKHSREYYFIQKLHNELNQKLLS